MKPQELCRIDIAIGTQNHSTDPEAHRLFYEIQEGYGIPIHTLKRYRLFTFEGHLSPETLQDFAQRCLLNPLIETIETPSVPRDHWDLIVSPIPGVTDPEGQVARWALEDELGRLLGPEESVVFSTRYLLSGDLSEEHVQFIAQQLLGNPVIHHISLAKGKPASHPKFSTGKQSDPIIQKHFIPLGGTDQELIALSAERHLALSIEELHAIRRYFAREETCSTRQKYGLEPMPTDVELEALAQTWSEHCKHKIFNAHIRYLDPSGDEEAICSIFQTYIKEVTEELSLEKPWLLSVFKDNAGIIEISENYALAFKAETHNSPSALDPYGGALTGILGVNRDLMGAGKGARIFANTNILCFAPPNYDKPLPPRLIHPKQVFEGVRRGIEHGGNKMGIPTVNGSIVFDEHYLGKPLVYCGSVGILPKTIQNAPCEEKEILPGDFIIAAGGKTGKDGLHGATFSSEALHSKSPTSAVQIGDPYTQKRLFDFILEARDANLYRTLTDNGAGGFSSSVGELAELSGGCEIHLERAPIKAEKLSPWEILLSESQERMTLAVDPEKWIALQAVAEKHGVLLANLGTFTDSGYLHALYEGETVALLSLQFLHHGLPPMELEAYWEPPIPTTWSSPPSIDYGKAVHSLLARLNICSKESIVRQYDHEVQGGTVLKPMIGPHNDGPSDAAIVRPLELLEDPLDANLGIVISHGICPRFSDLDPYAMATAAVTEAVANAIAVGADPHRMAILDNFCWPDPIYHPINNPDGKLKLGQLVRSAQGLYDAALIFETPIISGKDSMKNDYRMNGIKISIPPTLLISLVATIPDVHLAVSMDLKCASDLVYAIGITENHMGGTEFAGHFGLKGGCPPRIDLELTRKIFHCLFTATQSGLINACHDISDGGLAVACAEMSIAGRKGMQIDPNKISSTQNCPMEALLFSETPGRFILTIPKEKKETFEWHLSEWLPPESFGQIGVVTDETRLIIQDILNEEISALECSWKHPLSNSHSEIQKP